MTKFYFFLYPEANLLVVMVIVTPHWLMKRMLYVILSAMSMHVLVS